MLSRLLPSFKAFLNVLQTNAITFLALSLPICLISLKPIYAATLLAGHCYRAYMPLRLILYARFFPPRLREGVAVESSLVLRKDNTRGVGPHCSAPTKQPQRSSKPQSKR
jgi:hypothetical protein